MKCYVNGIDTLTIDLELVEWYIPPLPTLKDYSIEIAERDGEIDLGSIYGARVIQLVFFVTNNTDLGYYEKISAASVMFNPKKGDLAITFDGELGGKRYMARAAATIPISKGSEVRTLSIPLKMHDPFPEGPEQVYESTITTSPETIELESDGNVVTAPMIVLTNTGLEVIGGFEIKIEYLVEE